MTEIWLNNIKKTIKETNAVIVAEYTVNQTNKERTIVRKYSVKNGTISTIHGDVKPNKIYAVSDLAEANIFINQF